jgi:hypothetical protein
VLSSEGLTLPTLSAVVHPACDRCRLIHVIQVSAHRRRRLPVLVTASVLDQRYVGHSQAQEEPPVVQLCQAVLTLLCRRRVAGVDVRDAAGDDQFICAGEQETAQAEGFIAQRLGYHNAV